MIKKIAFIGQPTHDIERAKRFYTEVLGLNPGAIFMDQWAEVEAPDKKAIALDIHTPRHLEAKAYVAFETDDLAAELARLKQAGVEVVKDAWTNKQPDGTEICSMALIRDSEGNVVMLHQIAAHRAGA